MVRGCVKARLTRNSRGHRTPHAMPIVDPVPIWKVDFVHDHARTEFSHSLVRSTPRNYGDVIEARRTRTRTPSLLLDVPPRRLRTSLSPAVSDVLGAPPTWSQRLQPTKTHGRARCKEPLVAGSSRRQPQTRRRKPVIQLLAAATTGREGRPTGSGRPPTPGSPNCSYRSGQTGSGFERQQRGVELACRSVWHRPGAGFAAGD